MASVELHCDPSPDDATARCASIQATHRASTNGVRAHPLCVEGYLIFLNEGGVERLDVVEDLKMGGAKKRHRNIEQP